MSEARAELLLRLSQRRHTSQRGKKPLDTSLVEFNKFIKLRPIAQRRAVAMGGRACGAQACQTGSTAMIRTKLTPIATASVLAVMANGALAQDQQLTLCWAAWDPANALAELSKDFTAESGIQMKFEFVPWTNFADRFLNELNSGGKLCDLMIGDSQWLGAGAEYGHYVKLNDFFAQEGISMDDFLPATVYNYSTWPKGEPEYWALPAMGDALAWIYRKDWFARPEIQEAFQA
jgi:ABC-type glycerol-3-phosphate transport system substrate-binding protein